MRFHTFTTYISNLLLLFLWQRPAFPQDFLCLIDFPPKLFSILSLASIQSHPSIYSSINVSDLLSFHSFTFSLIAYIIFKVSSGKMSSFFLSLSSDFHFISFSLKWVLHKVSNAEQDGQNIGQNWGESRNFTQSCWGRPFQHPQITIQGEHLCLIFPKAKQNNIINLQYLSQKANFC